MRVDSRSSILWPIVSVYYALHGGVKWSGSAGWALPTVAGPGLVGRAHSTSLLQATLKNSVGEEAERIGGEERPGVVLLEVEPPDAVVPAEGDGPPIERDLGVGVERPDVRPG